MREAMTDISTAATARQTTTPTSSSHDLFWTALTHDAGCAILIYDTKGRIISANRQAARLLCSDEPKALEQLSLHDVMPAAIAEERLAHAGTIAQNPGTLVLDGMLNGRMTRATLRVLTGESDQEARILETVRPIASSEPRPEGVAYHRTKTDDEGEIAKLTTREREVLFHIGEGLSTAEIASTLGRSTKTVEWHRVSLGTKLGITNRVELARIAIRAGLTGVEG